MSNVFNEWDIYQFYTGTEMEKALQAGADGDTYRTRAMKIWGVSRTGLDFALALGSAKFGGNVKFLGEPERVKNHYRLRLLSAAIGPGNKIYYKERTEVTYSRNKAECSSETRLVRRRGPAVCWHVHTDFMRAIFDINPDARIQTINADYKGLEDFEEKYEETKYMQCECDD